MKKIFKILISIFIIIIIITLLYKIYFESTYKIMTSCTWVVGPREIKEGCPYSQGTMNAYVNYYKKNLLPKIRNYLGEKGPNRIEINFADGMVQNTKGMFLNFLGDKWYNPAQILFPKSVIGIAWIPGTNEWDQETQKEIWYDNISKMKGPHNVAIHETLHAFINKRMYGPFIWEEYGIEEGWVELNDAIIMNNVEEMFGGEFKNYNIAWCNNKIKNIPGKTPELIEILDYGNELEGSPPHPSCKTVVYCVEKHNVRANEILIFQNSHELAIESLFYGLYERYGCKKECMQEIFKKIKKIDILTKNQFINIVNNLTEKDATNFIHLMTDGMCPY